MSLANSTPPLTGEAPVVETPAPVTEAVPRVDGGPSVAADPSGVTGLGASHAIASATPAAAVRATARAANRRGRPSVIRRIRRSRNDIGSVRAGAKGILSENPPTTDSN